MFSQPQPQPHMASSNPNPKRCSSRLHVDLDPRGWRLWIQAGDSHLLGATITAGKAQEAMEVSWEKIMISWKYMDISWDFMGISWDVMGISLDFMDNGIWWDLRELMRFNMIWLVI